MTPAARVERMQRDALALREELRGPDTACDADAMRAELGKVLFTVSEAVRALEVGVPPAEQSGARTARGEAAELGRLAREVRAWARYVEDGEAIPGADETETLRAYLREMERTAARLSAAWEAARAPGRE